MLPVAILVLALSCNALAQPPNPERLFRDAVAAQQRGDDATAIHKYEELLKIQPDVVEVRANLGAALARQGRFDEAITQYRAALAKGNNPGLRLNLALAYYKKNAIAEASRELEELHTEQPSDVRIATLLADCYARLGRDKDVLELLGPLEDAHSGDLAIEWVLGSALIRTGHPSAGLERVEKVAAQGNSAEAHLLAGQTALSLNEFEKARDHADAALKLNPQLPGAETLRGTVASYLGDNTIAISSLRKAIEANPSDFDAQLALGAVLHTERDIAGARKHLEQALELRPKSIQALYQMARLERTEGKLESAAAKLEEVIRQDANWAQPHVELSAIYFRLKRQEDGERERTIYEKLNAESEKAQRP